MKQVPPRYWAFLATILGLTLTILTLTSWWLVDTEDLDQLMARARREVEQARFVEAAMLLDRILTRDPAHGPALLLRGQMWHTVGDHKQALADWLAVPAEPAEAASQARYLAGDLLLKQNRARDAEQQWLSAIQVDPSNVTPHEHLLKVYVLQRRRGDILQLLDEIRAQRSLTFDELVLNIEAGAAIIPAESAMAQLQAFVQGDADDLSSIQALAQYYLETQAWRQAITLLEAARSRHSENDSLRGLLAQARRGAGELEVAATLTSEAQPADPDAWWWWRSAANLAADQGEVAREIVCHAEMLRIAPDDVTARYRYGLLLSQRGREQEGKQHLEASVLLDRLRRQAGISARLDRSKVDVLLPVLLQVGEILTDLRRHRESAEWFELAMTFRPDNEAAREGLATARRAISEQPDTTGGSLDTFGQSNARAPSISSDGSRLPSTSQRVVAPDSTLPTAVNSGASDASERSPLRLRDVHAEAELEYQYFNGQTGFKYLLESMGGGVAVLDYDGDGWPDLFFPQGCRLPFDPADDTYQDRLFRNRGDGTFEDVTERAGLGDNRYGQGCAAGDLNNDGFVDLVVANYGRNTVYLNNGDGTFRDVTESWGLDAEEMSSSLALSDLNRDGNLDLYVVNYVDSLKVCRDGRGEISTCDPQNFGAQQDRLYVSTGDGGFVEVTSTAGIIAPDGKGLGVVIADFDDDGWPDIYVANDGTPNFLFHNQGRELPPQPLTLENSAEAREPAPRSSTSISTASASPDAKLRFVEKGLISGTAMSAEGRAEAGMGIACADMNGDQRLDLFVTNYYLETNTLYLNRGDMAFSDGTRAARLAVPSAPMLGFGTQAVDLDLDGRPELFVANGHIDDFEHQGEPWKMPPQVFRNVGRGRFEEVSTEAGDYFEGRYLGRGVARLDFNRDGRPDLVVVHQDAPTALLRNETEGGRRIVLQLHGTVANRDAVGARIIVRTADREQRLEICGGDGFYACNERRQFVGVGKSEQIEELEIHWPIGDVERWTNLPVDREITITQGHHPVIRSLRE